MSRKEIHWQNKFHKNPLGGVNKPSSLNRRTQHLSSLDNKNKRKNIFKFEMFNEYWSK